MNKWINVFDQEPEGGELIFIYDGEVHVGECLDFEQKPRKKTWRCDCHEVTYELDVIHYESDESLFIQWWYPLPAYPSDRKLP